MLARKFVPGGQNFAGNVFIAPDPIYFYLDGEAIHAALEWQRKQLATAITEKDIKKALAIFGASLKI